MVFAFFQDFVYQFKWGINLPFGQELIVVNWHFPTIF
jgi:hypothetical protein